jgi:hypothetical protein
MNYVKEGWNNIKNQISTINEIYTLNETIKILSDNYLYKSYFGRAKSRTMMKEHPKLYKSIYEHTKVLEEAFRSQNSYKGAYGFKHRLKFLVEKSADVSKIKCQCNKKYTWTKYCRHCPDPKKTWLGRKHTKSTKTKQRVSTLKYIEMTKGQVLPRYNIDAISVIEEYGKKHGYNFQHAENGGEFSFRGFFADAYDKEKNVWLEYDKKGHFDQNGKLKEKDIERQLEIEEHLGCKFIRIAYNEVE